MRETIIKQALPSESKKALRCLFRSLPALTLDLHTPRRMIGNRTTAMSHRLAPDVSGLPLACAHNRHAGWR
jgi:hypothetical protein